MRQPLQLRPSRRTQIRALLALTAAAIALAGWYTQRGALDPAKAAAPFRVGFQHSPPDQYAGDGGAPSGPVIEIFSEACRRLKIPIVWVYAPDGPEPNLRSGKVDLWPQVGDLPERRKFMDISEPWVANSFWVVSLESSGLSGASATAGKRVGHGSINLDIRMAQASFPQAQLVPFPISINGLEALCNGQVDAALLPGSNAHTNLLRDLQPCQGKQLKFDLLPNGQIRFGVASSRFRTGAREAATATRDGIATLAADGTIASIYFRWFMDPNNEATIVHYLTQAQERNRQLVWGLGTLLAILGVVVWQSFRLRVAHRAAARANSAKREFLANMSHEIRTPLNGVIGMTDLAVHSFGQSEQLEYLSMLKSSGGALLAIINGILDFSKIEAGKLRLDVAPFDLSELLDSSVRSMALAAHTKGLELLYEIDEDVPASVSGDPVRLRQIVLNLLGNAVKFTERGEVVVAVSQVGQSGEKITLQFAVRDTGIGIPGEKHDAVFEPFAQADGSTTRRYGGTGLGLTICRQLVALMNGRIWLDSAPDAGTAVHFTAVFNAVEQPAAISRPEPARFTGRRALVVDDNASCARLAATALGRLGFETAAAQEGSAALDLLRRRSFDLILVDLRMPGMSGLELAARIRAWWPKSRAKLVGLSSLEPAPHRSSRGHGALDASVSKPLRSSDLAAAVNTLFAGETAGEALIIGDRQTERAGLQVLVAEDNPINQLLIRRVLEQHGITVQCVVDGLEAIQAATRDSFDLILMDIQMPGVDGVAATAALRKREAAAPIRQTGRRRHVPIVALTAHSMAADRDRCLAAGMDGYISKPIQVEELLSLISHLCGRSEEVMYVQSTAVSAQ